MTKLEFLESVEEEFGFGSEEELTERSDYVNEVNEDHVVVTCGAPNCEGHERTFQEALQGLRNGGESPIIGIMIVIPEDTDDRFDDDERRLYSSILGET